MATNIIIPKTKNGSVRMHRLERALTRRLEKYEMMEFKRELFRAQLAKINQNAVLSNVDGLGQKICEIDLDTAMQMAVQYPGCFGSPEFVKDIIRDNPQVRVARPQRKYFNGVKLCERRK